MNVVARMRSRNAMPCFLASTSCHVNITSKTPTSNAARCTRVGEAPDERDYYLCLSAKNSGLLQLAKYGSERPRVGGEGGGSSQSEGGEEAGVEDIIGTRE